VGEVQRRAFGDHGVEVAALVDTLRASIVDGSGLALVAVDEGRIIGHVMFTPSRLDALPRLVPVQVLSPLGVAPEYQRRGVGSALVRHGIAMMTERAVPAVFLEGDPRYYHRFGFAAGAPLGFRKPSLRIPDAGFQVLRLPAYEPWMTGTLVYSEPFWQNDCVGLRGDRLERAVHDVQADRPEGGVVERLGDGADDREAQ
jgi:putative acetyltransferase